MTQTNQQAVATPVGLITKETLGVIEKEASSSVGERSTEYYTEYHANNESTVVRLVNKDKGSDRPYSEETNLKVVNVCLTSSENRPTFDIQIGTTKLNQDAYFAFSNACRSLSKVLLHSGHELYGEKDPVTVLINSSEVYSFRYGEFVRSMRDILNLKINPLCEKFDVKVEGQVCTGAAGDVSVLVSEVNPEIPGMLLFPISLFGKTVYFSVSYGQTKENIIDLTEPMLIAVCDIVFEKYYTPMEGEPKSVFEVYHKVLLELMNADKQAQK